MRSLGQPTTRDKLASMIAEIDQDGSETVDFDEFLTLFKQREQHVFTEGEAKVIFDEFDLDEDGAITANEWKHWLNRPNRDLTLSKWEMDSMIRDAQFHWDQQDGDEMVPSLSLLSHSCRAQRVVVNLGGARARALFLFFLRTCTPCRVVCCRSLNR